MKLSNGVEIPEIALGLWKVTKKSELKTAVKAALDAGYRHFDGAQIYRNTKKFGDVIKELEQPREELFITSKLFNWNHKSPRAERSIKKTLENLQTDYVDLMLVHFPRTGTRLEAWKHLEDMYEAGQAKAIGVSNFMIPHLEELRQNCKIKPMVNQVEMHVFLQSPDLVEYCKKHEIVIEAYSPLAHGSNHDDPQLAKIAKKHGVSPQAIMIAWTTNMGFVTLPKSVNPARIAENFESAKLKLDEVDMKTIEKLDQNLRTCWDPTKVE